MKIDILTLFPKMFENFLSESMIGIAIQKKALYVNITDIRDFATDKHRTTDDYPYGGGAGMVMKPEPLYYSLEHVQKGRDIPVIYFTAQGKILTQSIVNEFCQWFGDYVTSDVIVVGGGPSGLMAARDLARQGFKTLIVENNNYLGGCFWIGGYVMNINGKRVGDAVFTPGWTHYPKRIQYQTYNVSKMLHKGENALGAVLGNLWWSSGLGWRGSITYSKGPLRFFMQLVVDYQDGSSQTFITDKNWKTHDAPIIETTLYNGEFYDARLEEKGWNVPNYDDSSIEIGIFWG